MPDHATIGALCTLIAAASVGLAVDGETIPYVSSWGESGALRVVTEFAETIDRLARRIEDVLIDAHSAQDTASQTPAAA